MDPDEIVDDETLLDDEELDEELDEETKEDLGELDPDDDDDPDPPPRKSRAQDRIATLTAGQKAEKERGDRLERELQQARQGPTETPQQLQARRDAHVATLTGDAKVEFLLNEQRQQNDYRFNQLAFSTADTNDKSAFQGMCARSPAIAALEKEVEERLTELRGTGGNATREAVAKFLLGEKAMAKVTRAKTAGRKREQEGRDRQVTRPANGRGDVAPNANRRTSDREARRKRLEGMSI